MLWRVVALLCLAALCHAQRAKPPKINGGFAPVIYFRHSTDQKVLDCQASGIPEPEYEWRQNGKVITSQTYPGDVEVNGGKLQLLKPNFYHQGFYQCFASNKHGTSMSTVSEILKAKLDGYESMAVVNQGTYNEGDHVILTCKKQPESVPNAVYDWYLSTTETDPLATGGRVLIDQLGDLHFINVLPTDEPPNTKTYNCSLFNIVARVRVYGSPAKFKVTPSVGPVLPRAPSINYATAGENAIAYLTKTITLQCIPDGYPLPKIQWKKHKGKLPPGRHEIIEEKYQLVISNVTENDEGLYICTAVHGSQKAERSIFVNVKSEPIWVEKLKSVTVTNGKTAKFECVARSAIGEKDNVIVKWFRNGKELPAGKSDKIMVSGTELTVSNVIKPYDLMNVQCNVSNSIGYQLADAFLNVIAETVLTVRPQDKIVIDPGTVVVVPIVAKADPLYENLVTYRWSKDGQAVSRNPKDDVYVDVANKLVINASEHTNHPDFLKLLGNYSCMVSMGLENGEGDLVVYTDISSDQEKKIIAEAALDLWWIAIIVAVVVLILIIILICCLLYRNRGGTYPVDEKERRAGHDPEKELADSGFQDLTRADAPEEKKPYGDPDQVSLTNDPPLGGDTDSLDEYGEPDSSKFNEDGSFIGNYGGRKGRDANQSTV